MNSSRVSVLLSFLAALFLPVIAGAATIHVTSPRVVDPADKTLEGQEVVVSATSLTLAGPHTFASLRLENGAVLAHPASPGGDTAAAIRLTVTGAFLVDASSRIDVTGLGYGQSTSPGAGSRGDFAGAGGGHGGLGHRGAGGPGKGGPAFGSLVAPDSWGGPGANGGNDAFAPGGGLVHLEIGGTLTLEGRIVTQGANAWVDNQGGGAGGTIYVRAAALAGSGLLAANGGSGEWVDGGGGGGGRIAVILDRPGFAGTLVAEGGGGAGVGGAGTVYLKTGTSPGLVRIRNERRGEWTPVTSPVAFDLEVLGNAVVYPTASLSLGNLTLSDAALLLHDSFTTGLVVRASGHVLVGAGTAVNVDGRGFPRGDDRGPGAGKTAEGWAGSGAGHGGLGATAQPGGQVGESYGSILEPFTLGSQGGAGSGGPGTPGGGVVRLIVDGKLTVDGRLSAEGAGGNPDNSGGGSGGSLYLTVGSLSGSGVISANGGPGEWVEGGGGGGGRIAIYYGTKDYSGTLTAFGGSARRGGAGTIYLRQSQEAQGQLLVDNGGTWGNYTPVSSPEPFRLVLSNRAVVYPVGPLTLQNLVVGPETQLTHLTTQTNLFAHVLGDALVAGSLSVDGLGYPRGEDRGPGAGKTVDGWAGSGAGHGGLGATAQPGGQVGDAYDSMLQPWLMGSQGGNGSGGAGSPGGGAIRLVVDGKLTVDGRLSAEGGGSAPDNAGGGSGGSLYLTVGALSGIGVISANGGSGEWVEGGGGGGGRIAVHYGSKDFSGTLSAFGGPNRRGGAGTIYLRQSRESQGQLLVDNGGVWGNYTPLSTPEAFDLRLARQAWAYPQTPLTVRSLHLGTNTELTHLTSHSNLLVHVLGDALLEGVLSADGRGFPHGPDRGPGAGNATPNGYATGGGHGGLGATSSQGGLAGEAYDSILEPLLPGSQGGDGSGGAGTPGGGAIRLVVDGQMTVHGRLSADGGGNPPDNAGGGSGGSVFLTVGSLSGTGVISANGGPGEWVEGGGGGGGRIAIYFATNAYTGALTAYGGPHRRGGAGTIYFRKTGTSFGQLLIHNGGTWGNYTPLTSPEPFQVTLAEMAYVYPVGSLVLQDLDVRPNAIITHLPGVGRCDLHVLGGLTVAGGGTIHADGRGYPTGDDRGPGTGTSVGSGGGGGSHGGKGGHSSSGGEGGPIHGSVTEPLAYGSAGGIGSGGPGGAGGGSLRLVVARTFTLDGQLTARGLDTAVDNAGGGAGGSIIVVAGTLSGSGLISVDGGQGEWIEGGSGGGGRILLQLGSDSFTGTISARGGPRGAEAGGSGTLYKQVGAGTGGELILANGDRTGALTPLGVPPDTRLVLGSGTTAYPIGALTVASLRLEAGATLTHLTGQSNLLVQVAGDFTIGTNAVVTADAKGYPIGTDRGPGGGHRVDWSGSGAAHGGNGGNGRTGSPGGESYDSILHPANLGSQGGDASGGAGTAGGGAIRFVVGGRLTVDGRVSANAAGGAPDNAGGGAGGSLWIEADSLLGSGSFSANGGPGEWVDGGGGAGGRIAFHVGSLDFRGIVTARGGGGSQTGGAGTIYTRLAGEPVGTVLVENGDVWGTYTPLFAEEPFHLTIANRAQVYPDPTLLVGSLDLRPNTVLTHLIGQPYLDVAVLGDALIAGAIEVDGRGYPVGDLPGPGAGGVLGGYGSGAGHGGVGGGSRSGLPGGTAYGSRLEPTDPGSEGGAGSGGRGGAGGGAVRLLAGGTLTLDGSITANGRNGINDNSGGGSGGSIFLSSRAFAGTGFLQAKGAPGEWVDGGGGAGGRIALYRTTSSFTGTLDVSGGGGSGAGASGTVHQDVVPNLIWLTPSEGWAHGELNLQVASFAGTDGSLRCEFSLWHDGVGQTLTNLPMALSASTRWNSVGVPDGAYELRATLRNASGSVLADSTRALIVNNAVAWDGGFLAGAVTWSPDRVHVVRSDLEIAAGASLTLEPGTTVKFLPGVRLVIRGTASLVSLATEAKPVVLTSFLDDSVGGDNNLDGSASRPTPGAWRLVLDASGTLAVNPSTRVRYHSQTFGGALVGNTTWTGDSLREIAGTVVVPAGVTLRIEAGAILKFAPDQGLTVDAGGALIVAGTGAQPVVFTARSDDAFGGDTNDDGTRTQPAAGDWRSLRFTDGSSVTLDHALIRFGGNSVGNPWGAGGAIEALGGSLTARRCVISDALKDGAFCYGRTRFENCLVLRCDRGLTAVGTMEVVHCTLDANRIGLLEHVGQLNVRNSIVSRSLDAGIEHDLGGGAALVTACNVWNPDARRGNYSGLPDLNGRDHNLSAKPRYKDADSDDFHLNYASPGIDAADGAFSPETDFAGAPRYDDPRTGNTGVPAANGAVPDIGAYEFVESAPSDIDLVVTQVFGPGQVVAGGAARVDWLVSNRGAEPFAGPWHDALYLRNTVTGQRLLVAELLVGRNLVVGPGQSQRVGADIRVPGGVTALYEWVVAGNSRGDLFEGANSTNNESLSGTSAALEVPLLPLDGTALSSSFTAQEEQQWFRCVAPVGKDVRFELNLAASTGVSELYVGRDFMPTPENFSARQREFASPDTTAIASGSGDTGAAAASRTFYLLVTGRVLAETPTAFTLKAVSAAFGIESVQPAKVGNAGLVTLDIRGAGFATNTVFLIRREGDQRRELRRSARESGRVFATFDLAGFPAGPADLVADTGGLTVARPGAVQITVGGTADFYAELKGPSTTRAGRMTTWFVTYGNRGTVDVRLPLLRFSAPGAAEIQLYDSTLNFTDAFTFLGLDPAVLLPTLGPGREISFEVRLRTFVSLDVALDVLPGEALAGNSTGFHWASIPAPAGANAAKWAEFLAGIPGRLGSTVADYQALLEKEIVELAASRLRYSYLANIDGHWLFGAEPRGNPVPRPIITVPDSWIDPPLEPALMGPPSHKIPGDGITNTWFVVLTIEDYSKSEGGNKDHNLPGTSYDFDDMADFTLKDLRLPEGRAKGYADTPRKTAPLNRLAFMSIMSQLGKIDGDDNLVVVYSGHGGRKSDGSPFLALNGDYLDPKVFSRLLDNVAAGTTYFVNDSCHSEAFNAAVKPRDTRFVGLAATAADRVSFDTQSGGELVTNLKSKLRQCNGIGKAFELTAAEVTARYKDQEKVERQQTPVLANPDKVDLSGKPWGESRVVGEELRERLRKLNAENWTHASLKIIGSVDPNDKYALAGAGPQHWVHPAQSLPFQIVFENKTNAAAPAQEVLVLDDLDSRFDWSTFELKSVAFNDVRLTVPPGLQRYSTVAHVGTDPYEVTVDIGLNPVTGRLTWLMRSRDPLTGDLPEDPYAGFLPPNNATHRGEGSLTYTVRPLPGLGDGTSLTNRATIIFDPTYGANPPILTPWVTNTVDAVAPSSAVGKLPDTAIGEVPIQWTGTDAPGGSGIASYDIYASRDRGPFVPWLLATTETNARFLGDPGSNYRFYSVARDAAGNIEATPDQPDAAIDIGGATVGPVAIALAGPRLRVTFTGTLQSAEAITGPWSDVPNATNPYILAAGYQARFFRARR